MIVKLLNTKTNFRLEVRLGKDMTFEDICKQAGAPLKLAKDLKETPQGTKAAAAAHWSSECGDWTMRVLDHAMASAPKAL